MVIEKKLDINSKKQQNDIQNELMILAIRKGKKKIKIQQYIEDIEHWD